MRKQAMVIAVAGMAAAVAIALPALALAGKPVIHEHFSFTTDPYPTSICGIDVTGVDTVVGQYSEDASGAWIGPGGVTTVYTAPNGKSIKTDNTGVTKGSAPIDNGDGTTSTLLTINGQSAKWQVTNGPPIGIDTGEIIFRFTFDSSTGAFISFEVVSVKGPRPGADLCPLIVAALM